MSSIKSETSDNDQSKAKNSLKNGQISPPTRRATIDEHFEAENVTLIEDHFGNYTDEDGIIHSVKRFTWKNKNKIQVQVINYGARIISMKVPDRKGDIEDIVLGFDDLAGYIFYEKHPLGSVLGRVSNSIKNSTFIVNHKRVTLKPNDGPHCINGGSKGFDKTVWDTYVSGKKVIMSHVSPNLHEGFPGDLLVRATFELSAKNEFKLSISAQTTLPTIVDISNLVYFNLAGHHTGPDEIYRHLLMLNCNCFTPQIEGFSTGAILNVIHTPYDFQVPKLLGKVMGVVPKDGYHQNLCVNRGMYQNDCFVGRLFHPPSGRMLEVYSNQPGVQFSSANEFGNGNLSSMEDFEDYEDDEEYPTETVDNSMLLYEKIHEKIIGLLEIDEKQNFEEIRELILKFRTLNDPESLEKIIDDFTITPMQKQYLSKAREIVCEDEETDDDCLDLKETLSAILKVANVKEGELNIPKSSNGTGENLTNEPQSPEKLSLKPISLNKIPSYYKNPNDIRGKGRVQYNAHSGVALQTQNYPNAINFKNFPSCVLQPGEEYKHEIMYRFWVRAGNPNKWIKRNMNEAKQKNK